jgi:TolA-binding protein
MVAAIGIPALAAAIGVAITVTGAIVGLLFRGAALAWRDERDAAVDKADRLEAQVTDQQAQIIDQQGQITELTSKVRELEHRTNYEVYAQQSAAEHKAILDGLEKVVGRLEEQERSLRGNTMAVELLSKRRIIDEALSEGDERSTR